MPKLNVLNINGQNVGEIELVDSIFNVEVNEHVLYEVVKNQLANKRQGTQSAKTRAEVRGGGRKPWKQKGSGRARAGTIRSPLWRSGGVVFAAKPRDYSQKVNKKMYRGAIRSILSELIRKERLSVVDIISIEEARTKKILEKLNELKLGKNLLIVVDEIDINL